MFDTYECPCGSWLSLQTAKDIVGKTVVTIERYATALVMTTDDNKTFVIMHEQECCEEVDLIDIIGDLNDLLNVPITEYEQRESENTLQSPPVPLYNDYNTTTWSFNEIKTNKGTVTLRWFGQSNGCYSETAELYLLKPMLN